LVLADTIRTLVIGASMVTAAIVAAAILLKSAEVTGTTAHSARAPIRNA
jgi:hypothetical protein